MFNFTLSFETLNFRAKIRILSIIFQFYFYSGAGNNELSKNQKGLVHFTQHPDLIELKGHATYHEIRIDVALHGIDCVSHYKLYLCDQEKQCQDLPVTQRGNVTFKNLKDGEHFKYQLFGYNDEETETYVTEQFDIQTPLNVTTQFTFEKATNTSITGKFMFYSLDGVVNY